MMLKAKGYGAYVVRVVVLTLVLLMFASSALAAIKATVYPDSMTVYTKPSTSSRKMGALPEGTQFYITDYNSTWARIYYKGYTGYILLKDAELVSRIKGYTTADVPLYRYASASSRKLGTVPLGTLAYVSGRSGSYFRVQNKSGSITGYIHVNYLSKNRPSMSASSSTTASTDSRTVMPSSLRSTVSSYSSSMSDSQRIEYIIYVAQNQLGKRYSDNPSAPSTFDCAGLVRYCYRKAGKSVTSSAYSQGYDDDYDMITSVSQLRRGDMVCFNTNSSDSDQSDHTGIYIGGGKFIHASSAAGKVIVSDLSSGYYNRNFSWGLRIID